MRRLALAALILLALVASAGVGTGGSPVTAGVPTDVAVSLDCDTSTTGVQSNCTAIPGGTLDVGVVVANNSGGPLQLGGYFVKVLDPDTSRLNPPAVPGCPAGGPSFDCNPDHNQAAFSSGWSCAPVAPQSDTGEGGPGTAVSFISCFTGESSEPIIADGDDLLVATVHYVVPLSAIPGSVPLSISGAYVVDEQYIDRGACPPDTVPMTCTGATITLPGLTLAIDCDTVASGVQSACTVPAGPLMDVGVVLTNTSGAAREINGISFVIHSPSTARLNPPPVGCGGVCLESNPNFWQQSVPIAGDWDCDPPVPDNDTGADGPGQAASFLECRNATETGPLIAAGASVLLATNRYLVVPSAPAGPVTLTLTNAIVLEAVGSEIGSCAPSATAPMTCNGATVTVAPVSLQLDCNATMAGVQSKCYVSNMTTTRDVIVVLKNNSNVTFEPGDFDFEVLNPDISRLSVQIVIQPPYPQTDGNPDAHPDLTPAGSWACGPFGPYSDNDADGDPQTQQSFIACYNGVGDGPVIGPGGTLRLATVHYNIPAGADPGSVILSPQFAGTREADTYQERGTCEPVGTVAMDCDDAEVILYCTIEKADVTHDGRVNSGDQGKVASKYGQIPAPENEDQNFDGLINSGDQGLVASVFNKYVTECP